MLFYEQDSSVKHLFGQLSKSIYKAHLQSMSIRHISCHTHTQIASP